MNYRRLTREELAALEAPFVRYLAAQGIPADEWARIKVADESRADHLVDRFSAMVFDDVLRRATHLEVRTADRLLAYRCTGPRLELRGLIVEGAQGFDFRQNRPAADLIALARATGARVRLASAERDYRPDRAGDLYALLEAGAKLSPTGELFELFDGLATAHPDVTR